MIKEQIERKDKYPIPYSAEIEGNEEKIIILVNGFGGSKDSPGAAAMLKEFAQNGFGAVSLDFPAHGINPADGEYLRIDNCIEDLRAMELFLRKTYPKAEICYYSISYGAYITLLYLTKYKNDGALVFISSGAVNMSEFYQNLSEENERLLEKQGFMWEDDGDKPLKITKAFIADLNENDVNEKFAGADLENVRIKMIHGDEDEEVDYDKAVAFSERYGIELVTISGGDHRMTVPGSAQTAMKEALEFYK